jgi:hypothetical protein
MNNNTRIELYDNCNSAAKKLADGNAGAIRVLLNLVQNAEQIDPDSPMGGFGALLNLDSFGIYGPRIWMLYKDVCGENLTKTLGVLLACQFGIISQSVLNTAIDNRGSGLEVVEAVKKVREVSPNFGK